MNSEDIIMPKSNQQLQEIDDDEIQFGIEEEEYDIQENLQSSKGEDEPEIDQAEYEVQEQLTGSRFHFEDDSQAGQDTNEVNIKHQPDDQMDEQEVQNQLQEDNFRNTLQQSTVEVTVLELNQKSQQTIEANQRETQENIMDEAEQIVSPRKIDHKELEELSNPKFDKTTNQVEENVTNSECNQAVEEQNNSQEPMQARKVKEVRPKIIYNPKDDQDQYPGDYSDSGESEIESNAGEGEEGSDQEGDDYDKESLSARKKATQKSRQQLNALKKPTILPKRSNKGVQPTPAKIYKKQTLVINVADTKYPVVKFVGKKILKWKLNYTMDSMDWDMFWTDNAVQPDQLGRMQPYQKINHFPGMFSLARKNHLARNLMKMRKLFLKEYAFFPQTWLLPAEYNDFKTQFERSKPGQKTFIVKPEASCQGRGIFLTKSLEDLNPNDHYVVQQYLQKPYLLDGLKFDFRLYVLLAGCDPLRIYLYYEGLARFATEPYKEAGRDNLNNMCMHLTNYAINKDNPNFEFNKDEHDMGVGHKRSLTSVLDLLQSQGHDVDKLWKDIKRVLIKTIISAQPTLGHHYRSCQPDNFANNMCFELLGFDIILDSNLRPWLLEVNHTPSFVTDTPLDSFIKKNAIRDSLKLMNLTCKTKNEIVNSRKEIMQKRVLTGKKLKYSPEEKIEEIKKAQKKRDEFEDAHLGGFERIFPIENDDQDNFTEYLNHAQQCYEQQTGANIRRNTKKITEDPKRITNLPQPTKQSQVKDLEKIYNARLAKPLLSRKPLYQPKPIPVPVDPNAIVGEDETENIGMMSRQGSARGDFRIKKALNSPYNNKLKEGRVALGVKELRLGDDPAEEFVEIAGKSLNAQKQNPNQLNGNNKKILAYMRSVPNELNSKRYQAQPLQIISDQIHNIQSLKKVGFQDQSAVSEVFQKKPLSVVFNSQIRQLPSQNQESAAIKLQFQLVDNSITSAPEDQRLQQGMQRNFLNQISMQKPSYQQKAISTESQKFNGNQFGITSNNLNYENFSMSTTKEVIAAIGAGPSIIGSSRFSSDKNSISKNKLNQISGKYLIKNGNNSNGLFVPPKSFEVNQFTKLPEPIFSNQQGKQDPLPIENKSNKRF